RGRAREGAAMAQSSPSTTPSPALPRGAGEGASASRGAGEGASASRRAERGGSVLLSVQGLNAWYGRAHILFDVSLDVAVGEVVGLMGRNGAGKSTTLKAIMGLIEQRTGAVMFDGTRIDAHEPFEIARAGVGFVPEDRRIFTDLTVLENLEIGRRTPRGGAAA